MQKKAGFPWWLIFAFTCFLTWVSVFAAGIIVGKRKWIIAGLIYAIPLFLIYSIGDSTKMREEKQRIKDKLENQSPLSPTESVKYKKTTELYEQIILIHDSLHKLNQQRPRNYEIISEKLEKQQKELLTALDKTIENANPDLKSSTRERIVMWLWVISVFIAFFHALSIRKEYWELYNTQQNNTAANNNFHTKANPYVIETESIKKRIEQKIKHSKHLDSVIIKDLREQLKDFTEQIKLIAKDKQSLDNMLTAGTLSQVERDLNILRKKLVKEENNRLKREFEETIEAKEKLLSSYKNLAVQKKAAELRLDKALSSLKQVEYDLERLSNSYDRDKQNRFFKDFKHKTEDLNAYTDELHKQMDDTNL